MSDHSHNVLDHPEVQTANTAAYIGAFAVATAVMFVSLLLITVGLSGAAALATISILALIAALAQLYLMFRLDLSKERRWHTISLVMTVPLFIMAIGLTVWMFHTLAIRTMITPGS